MMYEVEWNNAIRRVERWADESDVPVTAAYMGECEQVTVVTTGPRESRIVSSMAATHERWFEDDLRMRATNAGSVTSTSGGFGTRR